MSLPAIATRRRACESGAGRPSTPPTSKRLAPGSTGPGHRPALLDFVPVIPAKAGIQPPTQNWIPAFAGMTIWRTPKMPKVLISDQMGPKAAQIFRERGIQVDEITGKTKDELIAIIGQYDGLAIRSSTKEIGRASCRERVGQYV